MDAVRKRVERFNAEYYRLRDRHRDMRAAALTEAGILAGGSLHLGLCRALNVALDVGDLIGTLQAQLGELRPEVAMLAERFGQGVVIGLGRAMELGVWDGKRKGPELGGVEATADAAYYWDRAVKDLDNVADDLLWWRANNEGACRALEAHLRAEGDDPGADADADLDACLGIGSELGAANGMSNGASAGAAVGSNETLVEARLRWLGEMMKFQKSQ